jgi:hypothetical protein
VLLRTNQQDFERQLAVTACIVVFNATIIVGALFVARSPPRLHRKWWTINYQSHLQRTSLTKTVPLIDSANLGHMFAPFFAICLTVFWMPSALARIYTDNRWCQYERDSGHNLVALLLCAASVVVFVVGKRKIAKSTRLNDPLKFVANTLMFVALFVFNVIVIEVIIFMSFVDKRFEYATVVTDCGLSVGAVPLSTNSTRI